MPARKKAQKCSGSINHVALMYRRIMLLDCRLYGSFTMENTLAMALGRVIEVQKGQSNQLTKAASAIFTATQENRISSMSFLIMLFSKC